MTEQEPLGIRNNNPGNLGEFNIPWQGKVGSNQGRTVFDTPENGIRAMTRDIFHDFSKKGKNTVRAITSEYAPPNENDTEAYIANVSAALGVKDTDVIDLNNEDLMLRLVEAKILQENGKQPYSRETLLAGVQAGIRGGTVTSFPPVADGSTPASRAELTRAVTEDARSQQPIQLVDLQPSDRPTLQQERDAKRETAEHAPGLLEGAGLAAKQDMALLWLFDQRPEAAPDPDFKWDKESFAKITEGLPESSWSYVAKAVSPAHAEMLRAEALKDAEREERLAEMGWTGVGLRIGASLLDPVGLVAGAASGGLGTVLTKGAAISRIGRAAIIGGTTALGNVGSEAIIVANRPGAEANQLLWAAGAGLAFGGAFGAFSRSGALAESTAATERLGKAMMKEAEASEAAAFTRPAGDAGAARTIVQTDPIRGDVEPYLHTLFEEASPHTLYGKARFFGGVAKAKSSDNPLERALGGALAEDAVGNADGSAIQIPATLDRYRLVRQGEIEWRQKVDGAWESYAKNQNIPWNPFKRGEAREQFNREVTQTIRDPFYTPAAPEVETVANAWRTFARDRAQLLNNPGLLDGTERRAVAGFEEILNNPNYVPRVYNVNKISEYFSPQRYGTSQMSEFFKNAIKAAQPKIADKYASRIANGYLKRLHKLTGGEDMATFRGLAGEDLDELRQILKEGDLPDSEIEDVLKRMAPPPKSGADARGKARLFIAEDHQQSLYNASTGATDLVKLSDLFENNIEDLFGRYNSWSSGAVALQRVRIADPMSETGEFLVDGLAGRGNWTKALEQVRAVAVAKGMNQAQINGALENLDYLHRSVAGIPEPGNATKMARILRTVGAYNVSRTLGQVGFAQLQEFSKVLFEPGFRAAVEYMPTLKSLWRNAASGKIDDALSHELEYVTTTGTDWMRGTIHKPFDPADGNGTQAFESARLNRGMDQVDAGLTRINRVLSAGSFMAPINTVLQRWGSRAVLGSLTRHFTGEKALKEVRLRSIGISGEMESRIAEQFKLHSKEVEGAFGRKIKTPDLGNWSDQEARYALESGLTLWMRRVVQENDPGQFNAMLSSPLGKMIFQFRTFMLGAWEKQFLTGVAIRDWNTFTAWSASMALASATYIMQSSLQSIGRTDGDKWRQERLSAENIAKAAFYRSGFSSLFPTAIDTSATMLGFDPLFFGMGSTSRPSDMVFGNPTVGLYNDMVAASGGASLAIRGERFSQNTARAMMRIVPLGNILPIQQATNMLIADMPRYSTR